MTHLKIRKASKAFAGVSALADVELDLFSGEVHALMGENGAGKSTLIKLLAGVQSADTLAVWSDEEQLQIEGPDDAKAAGFRFIHQELNIVPHLSVAENVSLGLAYPKKLGFAVDWSRLKRRAEIAFERLGITHIDVSQQAARLPTGDRMLMKIAGSLVSDDGSDAKLYVLDEPTAALSEEEAEKLFNVIAELKKADVAVLYVSHRMNEVMRLCDRVSVLKDGKNTFTCKVADTSKDEIIFAMTGREIGDTYPPRHSPIGDEIACSVVNLKTPAVRRVEFSLQSGEILGVTGLANAGQSELLKALLGLEPILEGDIQINGAGAPKDPSEAWSNGIAYVPKERRSEGLMLRRSVTENVALPHLSTLFPAGFVLNTSSEKRSVSQLSDAVRLKSSSHDQAVYQLSGGNQQKVVFARGLGAKPHLLLLDEPTRGVDVGAKLDIYKLVRELSENGCSIILTSTDLPELLGICDRILVMRDGRQSEIIAADGLAPADLLARFYEPAPSQGVHQ
ncbi:MAG: sugar ABC transporter ATP-binding protein [Hyphomicrobiales bacterium]